MARSDRRQYQADYYSQNRERILKHRKETYDSAATCARSRLWRTAHPNECRDRVRLRHRERRAFIEQFKDQPCVDCGQKYIPCVMDFDHVRGVKVTNVGTMVSGAYTLDQIRDEIAKCDVVCANCHRIRTWERRSILTTKPQKPRRSRSK